MGKRNVTVKDSVEVDSRYMLATCLNGCSIKYAQKLIQDQLKRQTNVRGYWTVWFEHDDGERYVFKLDNPIMRLLT